MNSQIKVGARWDDQVQNPKFLEAKARGLIDYVEVNFPISRHDAPEEIGLPVFAHSSDNPLSSPLGIPIEVASIVKSGADKADSPWVGDHLAMLGFTNSGVLGYVVNPLFVEEFADLSVNNAIALQTFYGRDLALELAPLYTHPVGDFKSEWEFMANVSERADTKIIFDVAHWIISNRNLRRPSDYGLDQLPPDRVVEIHIAGIRKSPRQDFWHDVHGTPLEPEMLELLRLAVDRFPKARHITLEHDLKTDATDFIQSLQQVRESVC